MVSAQRKKRGRENWLRGRKAESLAAWFLRFKGFKIIAQRYQTPFGELDLVARRGMLLIFVEVKSRHSHRAALESVTEHQQRRIASAAAAFLLRHAQYQDMDSRFDVIAFGSLLLPHHHCGAWIGR